MLRFNLLPKEFRERIFIAQQARRASFYVNILFGLTAILSLFLLFILIYLQSREEIFLNDLKEARQNPRTVEIESIQKDIMRFNAQLKEALKTSASPKWSVLLIELSRITPESLNFHTLVVEEDKRITIEGDALTREDLLTFEKRLRQSQFFSNVISPLSNYQSQRDITFHLSFSFS